MSRKTTTWLKGQPFCMLGSSSAAQPPASASALSRSRASGTLLTSANFSGKVQPSTSSFGGGGASANPSRHFLRASLTSPLKSAALSASTTAGSFSIGTKCEANLAARASPAPIRWQPVSAISLPRPLGMTLAARYAKPASGKRPMLFSGMASLDFSVATAYVEEVPRPSPQPMVMPWTRDTEGLVSCRISKMQLYSWYI
mmetsp:Transcript_84660/g.224822  ORF Transcript_84660/g.224822 Transcript_84660/m.224822 type:complete len:200 (-) Transcript_84660:366-965(-)